MEHDHLRYMTIALDRARIAGELGNRPIASIIVRNEAIIGMAENTMFSDMDPTAHAEIAAIRKACAALRTFELSGSVLYTTIEPCPMCLWAILESRIGRLVMGGRYAGLNRTDMGRYSVEAFLEFTGRSLTVVSGILQRECEQLRLEWTARQA